jgi:hypothetical protein
MGRVGYFRMAKNYPLSGLNKSLWRKRFITKRMGRQFSALLVQSVHARSKSKIRRKFRPRGHHDWTRNAGHPPEAAFEEAGDSFTLALHCTASRHRAETSTHAARSMMIAAGS